MTPDQLKSLQQINTEIRVAHDMLRELKYRMSAVLNKEAEEDFRRYLSNLDITSINLQETTVKICQSDFNEAQQATANMIGAALAIGSKEKEPKP